MKMRAQLLLGFAVIITITLAGVAYFVRQTTAAEVRLFMRRGGVFGAQDLVTALESYYRQQGSWEGVETLMNVRQGGGQGKGHSGSEGMGSGSGTPLRLVDADGVVLYDQATSGLVGIAVEPDELQSGVALTDADDRVVGYLLPQRGASLVDTGIEGELLARLDDALRKAALIAGGIALLLALALAYLLLRPVRQLSDAATRLGAGDLSQRVRLRGKDELAALGVTFNQMAESLQQAEERRRALTADIAHELRTPLAVQRANLEALQDGVYPLNIENLEPIFSQNQLMTRLVEDLRTLALADAGELQLERVETDLLALVQRTATRFQAQAEQKGVHILLELPESCPPTIVDPERIQQILNNLLQNSVRYTPEGGRVFVQMECRADGLSIRVGDSGEGIPPEALPHVFERFYRVDRSRNRAVGGTGLGLAIARKLAEAHGGALTAGNHPDGGALFTLWLPSRDR